MHRRDPLTRLVALALAAATSVAVGPLPARAADSPAGAVEAVLDAIVADASGGLDPLVCARQRGGEEAVLDLAGVLGGSDLDTGPLVAGATVAVDDRSVTVVTEQSDSASVALAGTMRIAVDPEAARTWVREGLEAAGQPAPDTAVDRYLADLRTILDRGIPIATVVEVVREDGAWLLCDVIRTGRVIDPDASPAPSTGALCDLVTVEELDAATGYAFVSATPFEDGCQWDAEVGTGYHTLTVRREAGALAAIRAVWMRGRELTVDGRSAWVTSHGTWVDLEDGLLAILPNLEGATVTEPMDARTFGRTVAELVVPRLP